MRGGAMTIPTRHAVIALIVVLATFGAVRSGTAQTSIATPQATVTPSGPDNLFFSGQTALADETASRGAGVEWLHPASLATTLDVGGFMGKSVGGWFSYGRVGAIRRQKSVTLAGALDLGGGRESSTSFSYTRARGEVNVPIGSPRILGQGEVDHIRVAGNVVTGLRGGSAIQITPRFSLRGIIHAYVSGGDVSPAGSIRGDYGTAQWRVLAGTFFSKKPTLPSDAVDLTPALHATRTTFVGLQVRAGAQDLIGVLDISEQPRGRVATLLLSLRVPLQ
jgi:hypothetical protein